MSKIDEIIKKLCPNGVEYKNLGEVAVIKNGKDYKHLKEGDIPVYGSGGVMTYVNDFVYDKPTVLIPRKGSLNNLFYVDKPFWNVDTIFYTEINTSLIAPRFLFHLLLKEHLENLNKAGGVPSLTQTILNKIQIPVPPLEIQEEIVHILDEYAELTNQLTEKLSAELSARKKQYEFYRDELLSFVKVSPPLTFGLNNEVVRWMNLGDTIISLKTGLNPRQNFKLNIDGNNLPYITGKDIFGNKINVSDKTDRIDQATVNLINKRACIENDDLLFASTGTGTVGRMAIVYDYMNQWAVSETLYCLKPKKELILTKFLLFFLSCSKAKKQYEPKISKGSVPHLKVVDLINVKIPVPPLAEQERIVAILDKFDSLVNDLTQGLPAEIEARKKQYEYYRDQLLTFKKAG
jgi:type I restriction enzyme S subunit